MTAAESARAGRAGRVVRTGQRGQLQHPLLPAQPARPRGRDRSASIGDVRLVTGRYFQDWLLLESDWNWRLEPDRGGALRAVGDIGSHWLDLMTFVTGQRVVEVMADLATFVRTRREPTGPVETYSTESRDRHRHARDRDRGRRDDPAPLRGRRTRRGQHQPDQRRAEELAPVRDRRVALVGRLGFGAAGPDLVRPPRAPERDPDQEPGPDGRRRTRRGRALRVATSRASGTPSRPTSGRSTRTSRPAARASTRATRPSPTATTRCWSTTRSPRARGSGAGSRSSATPVAAGAEARR